MNQDYLQKLARLAVVSGVGVQPGQQVVIRSSVDAAPLARLITEEAYKAKAGQVVVNFSDDFITRQTYLHADDKVFEQADPWKVSMMEETAKNGACYISIVDDDPDAFAGVDPARIISSSRAFSEAAKTYRTGTMNGSNGWTIVASASPKWAKAVYPDLSEEEAIEALWNDIFTVSRIDDKDPIENWEKHNDSFAHRISKLNEYQFEKFHYQNKAGTDLWVRMPKDHRFAGGSQLIRSGVRTFPNIPTEEVFSAPNKYGVNGRLVSTMPLNLGGTLVKDIVFEFKDGKIVDFDASEGKEQLEQQIHMDEGSCYLGEIALVPFGSPIQKLDKLFYNTLFDENASCHFAFGSAYPECVEGGQDLSKEELLEKGLNQSNNHVDFMVGSEDLSITGYTKDGKAVPVFVNGRFTDEFEGK